VIHWSIDDDEETVCAVYAYQNLIEMVHNRITLKECIGAHSQ